MFVSDKQKDGHYVDSLFILCHRVYKCYSSAKFFLVQRAIREKVGQWLDAIEKEQCGDPTAKVVPFDDLWGWAGYSTKGNAKAALDELSLPSTEVIMTLQKNPLGGRPSHQIMLTVDAAKKVTREIALRSTSPDEKLLSSVHMTRTPSSTFAEFAGKVQLEPAIL